MRTGAVLSTRAISTSAGRRSAVGESSGRAAGRFTEGSRKIGLLMAVCSRRGGRAFAPLKLVYGQSRSDVRYMFRCCAGPSSILKRRCSTLLQVCRCGIPCLAAWPSDQDGWTMPHIRRAQEQAGCNGVGMRRSIHQIHGRLRPGFKRNALECSLRKVEMDHVQKIVIAYAVSTRSAFRWSAS